MDRNSAAGRLVEARARFAEITQLRYASGTRLAARDADRLERIAQRIVATVDAFEAEFERLDAARDVCAYQGPNGLRIERSTWDRLDIAQAVASAFDSALHPSACAVLAAAIQSEARPR